MRACVLLLFLFACNDGHVAPPPYIRNELCDQPCAPGNQIDKYSRGECRLGTWHCAEDGGSDIWCADYIHPVMEVCNQLDDDCDGVVDNGLQHCTPEPERCDGIDNDLDGEIDEGIAIEYCYTGPPETLAHGECHPGTLRCIAGAERCIGEQRPQPELCDGLDNDCDGEIDEGAAMVALDMVVLFDNSGSMMMSAATLKSATMTWARKYQGDPNRKYALVTVPDDAYTTYGATPQLFQDFTDANTFALAVGQQSGQDGSPVEATLDALTMLYDPNNPLVLSWTPGARRLFVIFSDEPPQSDLTPPNTLAMVESLLVAEPHRLYVFTAAPLPDWDRLTKAGHGVTLSVAGTAYQIEQELDQIIRDGVCQ